jgi:hypothetical protein
MPASDSCMHVYVFGDQTFDIADLISGVLRSYDDVILQSFLHQSFLTLKKEVQRLALEQQAHCPRFSKLLDLVPLWRAGTLNPALAQALTCITHLGVFIR